MGVEREKMLAGELYDPLDPELRAARERARDSCRRILQDLFWNGTGDLARVQ